MVENVNIWKVETGIETLPVDWKNLSQSQISSLAAVWKAIRQDLEGTIKLRDFQEQMNREWAIETGIIENLYDIPRGLTVSFIEHGFRADLISHGDLNRPEGYVLALLESQKEAIEGVFEFVANRRELSVSFIKELHQVLMRAQETTEAVDSFGNNVKVDVIKGDWKKLANYPTRDGVRYEYCPPEQVASEMDRLVSLYLQHKKDGVTPEVSAAWLHHRFTQIHPFQDGNGRVARSLASLVLIQAELFPLVIKRGQKANYIDALEAADNGNLMPLVRQISAQQLSAFQIATAISAKVEAEYQSVDQALTALTSTVTTTHKKLHAQYDNVFQHAEILQQQLFERLDTLAPQIEPILRKITKNAKALAVHSTPETSHHFRSQIVQNARDSKNTYFADTSEYRSWVGVTLTWSKLAKVVFAFHGSGRPFKGNLVCAAFLEFKSLKDSELYEKGTLIPLSEDHFQFFYSDKSEDLTGLFRTWSDKAITVFIQEIQQEIRRGA